MTISLSRRGFLTGLIAAPAIIPINNLMRLAPVPKPYITLVEWANLRLVDHRIIAAQTDLLTFGISFTHFDHHTGTFTRIPPSEWLALPKLPG